MSYLAHGLVLAAIAIQGWWIEQHCTYGATSALWSGATLGCALYGGAVLAFWWARRPAEAAGIGDQFQNAAPALALIGLAVIGFLLNREVWTDMLFNARPCAPIEYEDGVRYRFEHAFIGFGYGMMPALTVLVVGALSILSLRRVLPKISNEASS